jgi:prenyltransferase beta subunit
MRWLGAALAAGLCCCVPPALAQAPANPGDAGVEVDAATRTILRGALKYLARQQHLDGSWSMREGPMGYPVAMTAYTLLAFLAMGNLPDEGEYSRNVTAGVQYLLDAVQPDGLFRDVSQGQYMYSHGIATIALAEMFGESRNPSLRPKLERLIQVILKAQSPEGGWRYTPQPKDADISVTVMQVVALRAAQNAGFSVPQEVIDHALAYVHRCYVPAQGGFSYQPGGGPGFARTASAVYSLQVLGHYDDPVIGAATAFMFDHLKDGTYFSYGHYYAAPAMYMIGGDTWRRYYTEMKQLLLGAVTQEGDLAYWDPKLQTQKEFNAAFCTPVYVHILAMPYHFVPLYQR